MRETRRDRGGDIINKGTVERAIYIEREKQSTVGRGTG